MTTMPTRQAIEAAEPLTFPTPRKETTITIAAVFQGYPITVSYTGSLEQLGGAIERLKALGGEPAREKVMPDHLSSARKPAVRVTPAYDGDGQPMCPVHRKPLVEGKYGMYCPSKAKGDEAANDKGYCSLKFDA